MLRQSEIPSNNHYGIHQTSKRGKPRKEDKNRQIVSNSFNNPTDNRMAKHPKVKHKFSLDRPTSRRVSIQHTLLHTHRTR